MPGRRLPRTQPARPTARVDAIVAACKYEIATGALPAGAQLPSLGQAHDRWRANHITVLRAYRRLIAAGLVEARPRAGYFVRQQSTPRRGLAADHRQLAKLHDLLRRRLRPGQTAVGLLQSLVQFAQSRADRDPECAFVECTMFQAEGHAREVAGRFDLPCRPICLGAEGTLPIAGTRLLLTTSFHAAQVAKLASVHGVAMLTVPIELSPELAATLRTFRSVTFLALDGELAAAEAKDARAALRRSSRSIRSDACSAEQLDAVLATALGGAKDRSVVLSTTLWEARSERWQEDRRVLPLTYRITEAGMDAIAATVGMPGLS